MASLIQPEKQTYIFTTFLTEFRQKIVKRSLFTLLFYVNLFGFFFMFQWALNTNATFIIILLSILLYEVIIGLTYYLGLSALFTIDENQTMLSIVVIAMHQNLWRNMQLMSPVILMLFAFFYLHPATSIFLVSVVIALQLTILKKAFQKNDPLANEDSNEIY